MLIGCTGDGVDRGDERFLHAPLAVNLGDLGLPEMLKYLLVLDFLQVVDDDDFARK